MNELVSVIIPCYNAEKTINEALGSIQNQTYRNLEIITIDDGSVDRTFELLNAAAASDSRIKVYKNEKNIKLIETLNKAVGLANGEYIARMDADDIAHPERIEREYHFLKKGNYDLVSAGLKFFRHSVKKISKTYRPMIIHEPVFLWASFFVPPVIHPAILCKAEVLKDNKYFYSPELLHIEDYELWHRLLLKKYKFGNIDKVLLYYRISPHSVSGSSSDQQAGNFIDNAQKNVAEYFKKEYARVIITVLCNRVQNGLRYAAMRSAIKAYKELTEKYISQNNLSNKESRQIKNYNHQFLFAVIFRAVKKCNRKDIFSFLILFAKYAGINLFLRSPQKTYYRMLPVR